MIKTGLGSHKCRELEVVHILACVICMAQGRTKILRKQELIPEANLFVLTVQINSAEYTDEF